MALLGFRIAILEGMYLCTTFDPAPLQRAGMSVGGYSSLSVHEYMCAYMCTQVLVYTYMCTHVLVYTCTHVLVYTSMYTCRCTQSIVVVLLWMCDYT